MTGQGPPAYGHRMQLVRTHTVVALAPVDTVARDWATSLTTGAVDLDTQPLASDDRGRQRFVGSWSCGGARGRAAVQVLPMGASCSEVEVSLGPAHRRVHRLRWTQHRRSEAAANLASALGGMAEGRTVSPSPARSHRRRPRAIALPIGGVATLAVAALAAHLLAPPQPVTVDTATARFRQAVETRAATGQTTQTPVGVPAERNPKKSPHPARGMTSATATKHPAAAQDVEAPTTPGQRRRPHDSRGHSTTSEDHERRAATGEKSGSEDDFGAAPDEGVYRYQTNGYEEVDVPRGYREFPEETTQTVLHRDCGYTVRWDPMEERSDENLLCVRDGELQPVWFHTYREFFGRSVEQHFTCRPVRAPRGATWASRCRSDDTTMTNVARSLGVRVMTVDGSRVKVSGTQVQTELQGANSGTRRGELWHASGGGIMVHTDVIGEFDVQGPFGEVHYREQYTLRLVSLQPQR